MLRSIINITRKHAQAEKLREQEVQATLISVDITDSTKVNGRTNYKWVQDYKNPGNVFQVFAPKTKDIVGLPVFVGKVKRGPFTRQIVTDVDYNRLQDDDLSYLATEPHAPAHEWPDNAPGNDPVTVYPRAIYSFSVRLYSSMTVRIAPGIYNYNGNMTLYYGELVDLTSYIPAAGNNARLIIYIDPTTNAAAVLASTEVALSVTPEWVLAPVNTIYCGWVKLLDTTTAVTEAYINDAKSMNCIANGNITIDTTNFDGALSSADDTAQKAFDTLDNFGGAIYDIQTYSHEPTGFPTRDTSVIAFDDATRTFSITPATLSPVVPFVYYHDGTLYTKSAQETVVISNTVGLHYIYYNLGTLTESMTVWNLSEIVPVATVYWDYVYLVGGEGLLGDERHGMTMDWATHKLMHATVGTRYGSGLSGTFGNTTFTLTAGSIYDEDLKHDIVQQTTCKVLYRSGSDWKWTDAQTKWYYEVSDILQYDNAGTITNVDNNKYAAMWFFATSDSSTPIYVIVGQRQDTTLADARANNKYESLSFGTLPFPEMKLLYRVIVQRSGTSEVYTEAQDFRAISNIPAGTYVATDHGVLTGLTDPDHPASAITVDTSTFGGALSAADDTVQKALATLDDASGGSGDSTHTAAYASRPAASNAGDIFYPSDGVVIERDTSAAWVPWGPIYPFVKPVLADFTWVNQGSATATDEYGAINLYDPPSASWNMRILKKAVPSRPYTITAAFVPGYHLAQNYIAFGLCWRQSSDGKMHNMSLYSISGIPTIYSDTIADHTGSSPAVYTSLAVWMPAVVWLRLFEDNTNRVVSFSGDGRHWYQLHTVARTDYLTADEVGVWLTTRNGTYPNNINWLSWQQS